MMKRGPAIYLRAAAIVYLMVVLFLCLADFSDTELELPLSFLGIGIDKYVHFAMFLPFPFLMEGFFFKLNKKLRTFLIFGLGVLLAVMTELGQLFLAENRSCEFLDLVADSLAILVGILLIRIFKLYKYIW